MYQQPPQQMGYGQMPPGMPVPFRPTANVGYGGVPAGNMPHKIVNPNCHKCRGTGWNSYKGKQCKRCVCKKCNGSGWNYKKNRACTKIKIKH